MAYRKFKLVNSLGDEYTLTDQNFKHFLNNPTGLGLRKSIDGVRVGNRYRVTKREYNLPNPSGELVFYYESNEDKYDGYEEFIRFISFYPLKLYYYTPGNNKSEEEANQIYLNCEVTTATKSEIKENDGTLRVPVNFQGFSFWLSGSEKKLDIDLEDYEEGSFTFPLSIPFSFGTDPLRDLVMPNNGTLITPIIYTIDGYCVNPYIRIFDENGEEYAASKIIGTFDYVSVNANDDNESIALRYNGSSIANPASKQDLTIGNPDDDNFFLTFLKVKPGNSKVTINFDNEFKGSISLTWRDEYASI